MKRVLVLLLLSLLMVPCTVDAKKKKEKEERWEELEEEVKFNPWPSEYIDTLRGWYGIAPQHNQQPKQRCKLPAYEKMVYRLNWGALNAGYGILENDRSGDTLKLSGKAVTNKFVSAFYRVRDYVYSVGSSDGLYPYFFEQSIEEKEYKQRRWTLYDFKRGKIHRHNGKKIKEIKVDGYVHNYVSLLYAIRMAPLKVGEEFHIPTFVHDKVWPIRFKVLELDEISTMGGKKLCFKVQPILVGDGEHGFNKRDKMYLWIVADRSRIVAKIKAKTRFGIINAELSYYTDGKKTWVR